MKKVLKVFTLIFIFMPFIVFVAFPFHIVRCTFRDCVKEFDFALQFIKDLLKGEL